MDTPVTITREANIAIVEVSNPPVNAASHAVRLGLQEKVKEAEADTEVEAILICCAGRTFIAGADIKEFGKPPQEPGLPDLVNQIEALSMQLQHYRPNIAAGLQKLASVA